MLIYFLLINIGSAKLTPPIVKLPLGKVAGSIQKTIDGKEFYSFEGIPYGKPPIGSLRFEEPQEIEPWSYIINATTKYACLQYRFIAEIQYEETVFGIEQLLGGAWSLSYCLKRLSEEDCLYLNIYTPTLNEDANLDVIFFIYGGAFMFNYAADFKPDILLNKDIVFVSVNYRLGSLGFLSTEDDVVPGNMGIKDQILGLKFINKYVKYFGGNPKSITLAGNSAGGASVHGFYLIPSTRGLFHRGISQSGTILNPWVIMEGALLKTKTIASRVGCPSVSTKEMVKCLKTRSGKEILRPILEFHPYRFSPYSPCGIVVDTWASAPLFPDHPVNLIKNRKIYDVPWIISHANAEGLIPGADFYDDDSLEYIDQNFNEVMPHILDYNFTVDRNRIDNVSQRIRKFYFGDKKISKDTFPELTKMIGDRLFTGPVVETARLHSEKSSASVYLYQFAYRGSHSFADIRTKTKLNYGASHVDDLTYVVKFALNNYSTKNDRSISDVLVQVWTSFATFGKPLIQIDWPELSKSSNNPITFLKIRNPDDIRIETADEIVPRKFWSSLPFEENEKLFESNIKDEL